MEYGKEKCINCNRYQILNHNELCNSCKPKCTSCNRKNELLDESKLCKSCYYSQTQFQNVSSGNQDIDDLIKATHNNQPRFRLEWIPFEDFTDIKQIGEGGFSEIHKAKWTRGRVTGWSNVEKKLNRSKNQMVVLKVLKDSRNINSAFLKELQNIAKSQPNSYMRRIIQCYGVSQFPKTNDYIFVMSYMSNGSLNDYLSNNLKDVTWRRKHTPHCWASLMQKCWHSDPSKRPTIDEIYYEVYSRYWDLDKIFTEAEEKRQELLNAGKFIAKYMHPHYKTHSQLLNPTIDSMLLDLLQGSKSFTLRRPIDSFQSISSDSFNIM
ncbi:14794_t:CDS:2 [Cetraspora pellucida]|uniref:14794_t:CDS:1 n=1 Tax=Cetraspora pellucida TaxID=1433469 RepID=A0ACA9K737_9GLOM|nr:14794_t:CDS:2 [Cetraspora pellucida]